MEREIRALQSLAMRNDRWTPPIVKTVATEGAGIEELASAIAGYESYLKKEGLALRKDVENWQERLIEMLLARINGADAATLQEIVKVELIERADDRAPGFEASIRK